MLTAAVLVVLAQPALVTYAGPAARLERLLPELGKVVGQDWQPSPALRDEVLLVRVDGVKTAELKDRIAKLLSATWKVEAGGIQRLALDPGTYQQREKQDLKARTERIAALIQATVGTAPGEARGALTRAGAEKLLADAKKEAERFNPRTASGYMAIQSLERRGPSGRLHTELIRLLDPAVLARIPPGMRMVLSTSPNRMQYAFSGDPRPALRQFSESYQHWAEVSEGAEVKFAVEGGGEHSVGGLFTRTKAPKGTLKALVTVSRGSSDDYLTTRLLLSDESGGYQTEQYLMLRSDVSATRPFVPAPGDPELVLEPEDLEVAKALATLYVDRSGFTAQFRSRLTDPVARDPLELAQGPFLSWAKTEQKPLLVHLRDENFAATAAIAAGSQGKIHLGVFKRMLKAMGTEFELDEWLVARPSDWTLTRTRAVDRRVLASYIQERLRGPLTLERRAEYALLFPSDRALLLHTLRTVLFEVSPEYGEALLRFYGAMSPAEREAGKSGVPLARLGPKAREELERTVMWSENDLGYSFQHTGAIPTSSNPEIEFGPVRREPTERFPNGLPPELLVHLTEKLEEVVQARYLDRRYASSGQTMSAQDYAWQEFIRSRPDLFGSRGAMEMDENNLGFGQRRQVEIKIAFTPFLSVFSHLNDTRITSRGTLAKAPKAFKAAYDAALASIAEGYKNAKPSTNTVAGEKVPPPSLRG
jgi:hypothetical protein